MLSRADIYPFATLKGKGSCLPQSSMDDTRRQGAEVFKKVADQLRGGYRKAQRE